MQVPVTVATTEHTVLNTLHEYVALFVERAGQSTLCMYAEWAAYFCVLEPRIVLSKQK